MEITLSVDRSAIPSGGKANVTVTASENIYAVECRATLSGASWGHGVGTDVLADDYNTANIGYYELPTPSDTFAFDVESNELVTDGTYRITIYTRDSRGVWDDTFLFIPLGSDSFVTADGLTLRTQRSGNGGDYNSVHTGQQIDNGIALANTAVQQIAGKGLSTEDYTTAEKTKLGGIAENANNYSLSTASGNVLGGIKADAATASDTTPVRIGADGKLYTASGSSGGSVASVNGKTGSVILDATDVGALPDTTTLADLQQDANHRTVTDAEKTTYFMSSILTFNILAHNNAGAHNSIYRGKHLGSIVEPEQWNAIDAGTFDDLYIGDYWTINGINWRIAAFDYWLHCGDVECTTHHVNIVPGSNLVAGCPMNSTNTTTGAYVGSNFYTGANGNFNKARCVSDINSAFGSAHILSHREYLKNAVTDGYESVGAWYDSTLELMTEQMVFGHSVYGNMKHGTNIPLATGISLTQLPLFALDQSHIVIRNPWWLRDVASATQFVFVYGGGDCSYGNATNTTVGIRPVFAICA